MHDVAALESSYPQDGGAMGARIRAHDWSRHPIGAPESWPISLKTLVDVMLGSSQPMFVAWGPERSMLYNDAYATILAAKNEHSLGQDILVVWHEIRDDLAPIIAQVDAGEPVQYDDIELWMERRGYREEAHFSFSYTPVKGSTGTIEGFFCACQEITGQVLAERQLRESEARARADAERVQLALDAGAIIGTWFWDLPNDRFTVDDAFAEAFGIDPALGHSGLSLEQVIETVHPHDRPGLTSAIEAVVASGGQYAHQYRVRRSDGEYHWIEANGRVNKAADGTPLSFPGVLLDMDERRATQAELQDTTRRLDAILSNTREAVFLMDERQHCIYANRAAEKLTGYRFDQLSGQPLHDVIHNKKPDGSPYPLEECPIDRAFPSRAQMSGEELFVAPDGTLYPVAFTASPVLDDNGEPVGTVIEARDISEEKAALLAQRQAEERYRLAARATNDAIWDWDLQTNYVQWNEALHTLTGFAEDEVEPTGRWWIEHIHPDDRDRINAAIHAVIDGSETHWTGEYRFRRVDGGHVHVFDRGFVIRDENGQAVRMIGAMLDLTERHRAAEALRELNERLEQRVAEEIAERAKAEEALRQSQKIEAVGQLTGGIAHDFNNLLTVVTGNIDMASRALAAKGEVDPRAGRALENALKGAERAAALTQRLLAFSRRQPLAPKALDADRLVSGMSDMVQRALGEMVKLEVVTSPGLWRVEADPNQLESAILNLAVNARDAMPDGGTLTIETANARLDEVYAAEHAEVAPGQYVVIAVTDSGTGMSKETALRVFEPFFTTKEVGKGTGLGLSMVYGFTKQSGGHVKIYTEEGHGTTVKIYLPRLVGDIQIEEETSAVGFETSQAQETILVVEDDDDVRTYTVECLRELGYRVHQAHDGAAALRVLEREVDPIDLMFTDVVMPGMTGRELADKVREAFPTVKVLFTSGYTRNAIVHGSRLDDGVEFISKPFTYISLAQKVADVLDKGRTGRVLLVEHQPTLRAFAAEGLASGGYVVDEAQTGAEALAKVRAARGAYDAVFLEECLPGQSGDIVAVELRKLHADLPMLIASDDAATLGARFADDRCTGVIDKPYNAARMLQALEALGVRCRAKIDRS